MITNNDTSFFFFPLKNFIDFRMQHCKSKYITEDDDIDVIELYPNPNIKNPYKKIELTTQNTKEYKLN